MIRSVRIRRAPARLERHYMLDRGGFNHPHWMRRPAAGHMPGTAERAEVSDVQAAGHHAPSDVAPEPGLDRLHELAAVLDEFVTAHNGTRHLYRDTI